MKKLLLVDVPDGWVISQVLKTHISIQDEYFDEKSCHFKEIPIPAIEEIERHAAETTSDMKSWLASVNGANWLKSKLR